ncbi:MAG: Nif3-like dinuclear metal center hexameric protein [Oscillospiraceae bacterium]|nr:Nif3-like dinuclear metal center hexameric protein [Oscillospiraceae bacterium]
MTTVQNVLDFIETIAPTELKMEWDNVGLLCGRADQQVQKILVALDPFTSVCEEAAQIGADLLVTHHPLIFQPLSAITDKTTVGRAAMTLIKNNIAAINAHTNLDCADGGVNDTLAQTLKLKAIQKVPTDSEGLLRQGEVETQDLDAFLHRVEKTLDCNGLRYVSGGKPVNRVAVGGGACGSALYTVIAAGCDTFVTADVKYNQFCDAKELGLNLIDAGHFPTENPVMAVLAAKLQTQFPDLEVKISETHRDSVKYY